MSSQAAIIEGLLQSGLLKRPVERIDTHSAIILLSGDRAIKVKRQIQFPFLDYSTLERRRRACESEIQINRRFAPEIYKQVIPIRRDPTGRFYLSGEIGDVVEWAIEMRRFDQDDILENLIQREGMTPLLARKVTEVIQTAHAEAPISDTDSWLGSLLSFIKSNDSELKGFDDLFPKQRVQSLTDRSLSLYESLRPTLWRRGSAGLVRQCHGDLHLANVVMIAGKPTLFDALEFDPSMAAGDVMYDLAFLLMDLINIRQVKAANMVLNDYLIRSDHLLRFAGLAALPLFMSIRAAIRAKVSAVRMSVVPRGETESLWKLRALSYFELAERLLRPCQAALIGVGGLSGSGKSVLACGIAPDFIPEPGAILLRSDVERKAMFGGGSDSRLPEAAYSKEVSRAVYQRLIDNASEVLSAGFTAIVDAVFASEAERNALETLAGTRNVPFCGLFLMVDLETRLRRVRSRQNDFSDADISVARMQASYDLGRLNWKPVDAAGEPNQTLEAARIQIAKQLQG